VLWVLLESLNRHLDTLGHVVIVIVPERNELWAKFHGLTQTHIAKITYRLASLDMEIRDLKSLLLFFLDRRPILLGVIRVVNDDPVEIRVGLTLETFNGKIKAEPTIVRRGAHHH
jgi:hypothetical protein